MPHELTIKHLAQSVLTEKDVQHCRDTQTEFVKNTINCREQLLSRWFPSLVVDMYLLISFHLGPSVGVSNHTKSLSLSITCQYF